MRPFLSSPRSPGAKAWCGWGFVPNLISSVSFLATGGFTGEVSGSLMEPRTTFYPCRRYRFAVRSPNAVFAARRLLKPGEEADPIS